MYASLWYLLQVADFHLLIFRAIDNNGDPSRLRLPRHFELDGAVCPYEWYKAEGRSIIDVRMSITCLSSWY